MINLIKFYKEQLKKKRKYGYLFILLFLGLLVACQGALEEGNPFGPVTNNVTVRPDRVTVDQAGEFTFTAIGGTTPFHWTSTDLLVGTIIPGTGVFTAGAVAGTTYVTVVDAVGDTDRAFVRVSALTLGFDVVGLTQAVANTASPAVNVNANNSGAGVTATVANNNVSSTFTEVPTIGVITDAITLTSPATLPNATQGDQVFTITVADVFNNNTGTFIYTLTNDGT